MYHRGWKLKLYDMAVLCLMVLGFFGLYLEPCRADMGVSIGSGCGVANIVPIRLGVQKEFERRWCTETDFLIGGYWEGSLYYMKGKHGPKPKTNNQLFAGALAGVLRFEQAKEICGVWPYLELGIGLSWLSQKEIGGRKLGSPVLFEDRLGLGVRLGDKKQYDISYRAIHFSNAYIGRENNGINLHVLVLGYWFH